jgi:putative transposase
LGGKNKEEVLVGKSKRMPTLWEVPDALWERIQPILEADDPVQPTGRKKADRRRVLDGIVFRLRTGCQWNHIPRVYGDDSTIHRYFQRWCAGGVFATIWALLVEECEEFDAVDWQWQAADTALGKARSGGTQSARIPRIGRKMGPNTVCWSKRAAGR